MEALELKIPPVVVGLAIAIVSWWVGTTDFLVWSAPFWLYGMSLVLASAGVFIAVAGVVSFYQARTTVNPHKPGRTSALVTTGIYRWTRNPMYLGMLLVLLGWGMHQGGAMAVLVTVLFIPYMTRFQVVPEERVMKMLFGEEYEQYALKVRRWI